MSKQIYEDETGEIIALIQDDNTVVLKKGYSMVEKTDLLDINGMLHVIQTEQQMKNKKVRK